MQSLLRFALGVATAVIAATLATSTLAASRDDRVASLAAAQKQPFLDNLRDFVSIESGSRDREGLDKLSELIAGKFRALGAQVEFIEPGSPASPDVYKMADTPERIG